MTDKMQRILTLDEIKNGLKDLRLYNVSRACNVSYPTLLRMSKGERSNYELKCLANVSKYLLDRCSLGK